MEPEKKFLLGRFWWGWCVYNVEAVSNINNFQAAAVTNDTFTNDELMDKYWIETLTDEKHSSAIHIKQD